MFDYGQHEVFVDRPAPDQELIRYLSLPKFLNLLVSSSLNFAAPTILNDPWEGEVSEVNVSVRPHLYAELPPQAIAHFEEVDKAAKNFCYVSCWHEFSKESSLMWKAYASEQGSLALRTTWKKLTGSIKDDQEVFGARVQYVDRSQTFIPEGNLMWRHMHKGHQYEDEKEVRLVVVNRNFSNALESPSISIKVDVNELIGNVILAPGTPKWVEGLLAVFKKDYGLNADITRSSLDIEGRFAN